MALAPLERGLFVGMISDDEFSSAGPLYGFCAPSQSHRAGPVGVLGAGGKAQVWHWNTTAFAGAVSAAMLSFKAL